MEGGSPPYLIRLNKIGWKENLKVKVKLIDKNQFGKINNRGGVIKEIIRKRNCYLFLLPKYLALFLFMFVPSVWSFMLTFQGGSFLSGFYPVGLENYRGVVSDELFLGAIKNTLYYSILVIPAVLVLALITALLLTSRVKLKPFFRATVLFPTLGSIVVASIIWKNLFHPAGPINILLSKVGISAPIWLGDTKTAMPSIALMEVWRGLGFYTLLFVAQLQGIPQELYEAAVLDGATSWKSVFHITLPLMKPIILFALVMATIWNIQVFDPIYVMTEGGPAYTTVSIVWYIYREAFFASNVGYASCMAMVLLGMILVFVLMQIKFFTRD